jgi:hypothetical protein
MRRTDDHGGNAGDLSIAAYRWEARQLRMQASVVAELPTGRRADGASVPPDLLPVGTTGALFPTVKWREGVARPVLFESAGRWAGHRRRALAFGAVVRPSGPRRSFDDGWDLATR